MVTELHSRVAPNCVVLTLKLFVTVYLLHFLVYVNTELIIFAVYLLFICTTTCQMTV